MAKAAAAGAAAPANGAAAAGGTGNEGGGAPAAGAAGAEGTGAAAAAAGAAAGDAGAGAAGAAEGTGGAAAAGAENAGGEAGKGKGNEAGAAAGAAKAPAKYELTTPAGGLMDADDVTALEKVARENDMSNEEAQAYLDEMGQSLKAQSEGFLAKLKADPEYGGDRLAESQRLANAFVDRLRPAGHARRDAFLRFAGRGGAINHPEVVALLADAGKLMDEDGHVAGASSRAGGQDTASKMYDHPTSKAADGRP